MYNAAAQSALISCDCHAETWHCGCQVALVLHLRDTFVRRTGLAQRRREAAVTQLANSLPQVMHAAAGSAWAWFLVPREYGWAPQLELP